jgi:hypothetical protein
MESYTIVTHVFYLLLSIRFTIWVGQSLFTNGRVFLVDSFRGNEPLADSINHLLLVGFYLINVGYVSVALKYGTRPQTIAETIETLSTKVGLVLLVLGAMHLFNVYVFSRMRRNALAEAAEDAGGLS